MSTDLSNNNTTPEATRGRWRLPVLVAVFTFVSVLMAGTVLLTMPENRNAADGQRAARIPEGGANAAVGWEVPDFTLTALNGETSSIADYRGKIVFLNFWATWCGPCQREMPVFDDFMAQDRGDAVILAVNNGEEPGEIQPFMDTFGLQHVPVFLDPDYTIADGFGVMNLPVTYVIDGEGVVRYFKLGEVTQEDINGYIEAIQSGA